MRTAFARRSLRTAMLATTALFGAAGAAAAQEATDAQATQVEDIVVVGTQIRGAKVTAALPVTVVGEEQILAAAATSGDELLRTIPQMGDVTFNSSYLPASSNSARGDTGSVNLRSLGIGNTLVLLNGRRVVGHPTSQANEHLVPVLTYNTNAIPVSGLKRLEVLRDGAAAIYGADAVAGVVNTVLRDDMNDWTVSSQYGGAEGTGMREFNFSLYGGTDVAEGRGNLSLFFNYDHRDELTTLEQPYTASDDKRPLFAGTGFENNASLNGVSTLTPWGQFTLANRATGTYGGQQFTTFTIQPDSLAGCAASLGGGLCLKKTTTVDPSLRGDTALEDLTVIPEIDRFNLFLTGRYKINDAVEAFGELGGYYAKSHARQAPINTLSSVVMTIPGANFYNPFKQDILLTGYRFNDMGPINVDVTNEQYRILGGLRGEWRGWNWESALLWSEASAKDVSDNISTTRLAEWAAKSTPDAYNFFNGGDPTRPRYGDSTPSNEAALNAIRVDMVRKTKTELGLWDFKVSRPDLFTLPGGPVGVAAGVEARTESQLDDRDSRIDGTIRYTDKSGAIYSDLINSSENPDTYGERDVLSAYLEFAAPLVSPEMNIPLVHNLEVQIAGRFENYSDFGDVAKPKVAAAWDLVDGFRIRASWAQGFRAPNLEQINATVITRSNSSNDYIYCEALIKRGAAATGMTNMNQCGASYSPTNAVSEFANINTNHVRKLTAERRSGNPDLQPEESETTSVGVVIQPRFLPEQLGSFTFTADWWQVEQTGMVGLFRGQNALILDYLLRKSGGSNPNVVRADPTAADQAIFAGTGLAAAGEVLYITDAYTNQQPQTVEGLDLGLMWSLRGTKAGDFSLNLNVSHLLKYYLEMSPGMKALSDAKESGAIAPSITFGGRMGDMIGDLGRPEWKWSLSGSWRYQNLTLGAFTQYISSLYDSGLVNSAGDYWTVDSTLTANIYAEYQFDDGLLADTAVRVGLRNVTDEQPPLAGAGYVGTVYQPYGRYWHVSIRKTF
ncbi:TonB-dependent receptor plug domain-containing protein [Brevundimonas faecalis]|uniref:TonB-dependent receptor plug domain-containing protein n=1 Tax=Brevundimonas faecalis TaxID=947378 RepID=UPI0036150602